MNRLSHPKALAGPRPSHPVQAVRAAQTPHVTVTVDPALGIQGHTLAAQVAAIIQAAYAAAAALCVPPRQPTAICQITQLSPGADGTGGAEHSSCADTLLICDAAFGRPARTAALFIAELVEVFEALWNNGFDCGNTNGEGLSRAIAEAVFPGQLDDYSTASVWLDTPNRPDWIGRQQGTDTDPISVGCAVLFLNWLHTARGIPWPKIVAAGGSTLAQTYSKLGLGASAYADFAVACNAKWRVGMPSGVTTDNPWTAPAPPSSPPPPAPAPAPPAGPASGTATLTLPAALPAGSYTLELSPQAGGAAGPQLAVPWALVITGLERTLPTVIADARAGKAPAAILADVLAALGAPAVKH